MHQSLIIPLTHTSWSSAGVLPVQALLNSCLSVCPGWGAVCGGLGVVGLKNRFIAAEMGGLYSYMMSTADGG